MGRRSIGLSSTRHSTCVSKVSPVAVTVASITTYSWGEIACRSSRRQPVASLLRGVENRDPAAIRKILQQLQTVLDGQFESSLAARGVPHAETGVEYHDRVHGLIGRQIEPLVEYPRPS